MFYRSKVSYSDVCRKAHCGWSPTVLTSYSRTVMLSTPLLLQNDIAGRACMEHDDLGVWEAPKLRYSCLF
jgi:hypothetical protein